MILFDNNRVCVGDSYDTGAEEPTTNCATYPITGRTLALRIDNNYPTALRLMAYMYRRIGNNN